MAERWYQDSALPDLLGQDWKQVYGNRAEVTTVEEMVQLMKEKYGQASRIWVMDPSMVSEQKLPEYIKRKAS